MKKPLFLHYNYRVFQKFVPIVNCILSKAFNTSLGKCKLIQVTNLSIKITVQSNFKLKFEEIIYFFKFCPNCTRTRGFSRHTFPAHFVGFRFWYFYRFLLFSLLLHENEGLQCLC